MCDSIRELNVCPSGKEKKKTGRVTYMDRNVDVVIVSGINVDGVKAGARTVDNL